MTRRCRYRSFMLVELLLLLLPLTALVGVLFAVSRDFIDLQRRAGEHANRMAAVDSLSRALHRDAIQAREYRYESARGATTLTFVNAYTQTIEYHLSANRVVRIENHMETAAWMAHRSQFRFEVIVGRQGSLLLMTLVENKPPHRTPLAEHSYAISVLLPPSANDRAEESP
jgi:hypothetical protein